MTEGIVFDLRRYCVHDGPGIRTTVFFKGCPLRCLWCHNPESISPAPTVLRRPERCIGCGACIAACPRGFRPAREAGDSGCSGCGNPAGAERTEGGADFAPCVDVCPAEALQRVGRRVASEEILEEIRRDRPFFDESGGGVTFSGGEPLAQAPFLFELLDACRAEGIRTAVDTSGFASRDVVLEAGRRADLLLYDLKLMDEERHRRITGVSNLSIRRNLEALAAQGANAAVRVPVIPGVNDLPGDLEATADFVRSLGRDWTIQLLPYHDAARNKYRMWGMEYKMGETLPPSEDRMKHAASVFAERSLAVSIGG